MSADEVSALIASAFPEAPVTFRIEEVRDGGARVRLLYNERYLRPGGTMSGPSLMTLADTAMWVALLGHLGPEVMSVTVHLSVDFLRRPAPGDVVAEVELLKVGRRLANGAVTMYSDGDTRPVAFATVTYTVPH